MSKVAATSTTKAPPSVLSLPGVGPRTAADLERLGITNLKEMIEYLPLRHENYGSVVLIKQVGAGQPFLVRVKLLSIKSRRSFRRRLSVQEGLVSDSSGTMRVTWFNQPYLADLKPGTELLLHGQAKPYQGQLTLVSPEIIRDPDILSGQQKLQPVYRLTGRITTKQLRYWEKLALAQTNKQGYAGDFLPQEVVKKHKLSGKSWAIRQAHFPSSATSLALAQKRLAFEELLLLSLYILRQRQAIEQARAPAVSIKKEFLKDFVAGLPYHLTEAQRRASWQILKDLARPRPMNRLLEGDVGSGKTLVAALALVNVAAGGGQAVILAPTQVLARQHAQNIRTLLTAQSMSATVGFDKMDTTKTREVYSEDADASKNPAANDNVPLGIALYTGTTFEDEQGRPLSRELFLRRLALGHIKLVVATHAILKPAVSFKNLQLFVVDEQHRFGVKQRQLLKTKVKRAGFLPHLLSMTATPIPRSLALTLYGDLDISILDEKPGGPRKITTKIISARKLASAYQHIIARARRGEQAFIMFPLIDESDFFKARAVTAELAGLKKSLKGLRVEMLHGRMRESDKADILARFAAKEFDVLAATPVIEVGIDIPGATTMVIMSADRFGLAQLHQLRGRVGRDRKPGHCFLCPDQASPATKTRLQLLSETDDGFKLAQADLELRGPGEIFGTRQHGQVAFKYANFLDIKVLAAAKEEAARLLNRDKTLKSWPLLQKKVLAVADWLHLE